MSYVRIVCFFISPTQNSNGQGDEEADLPNCVHLYQPDIVEFSCIEEGCLTIALFCLSVWSQFGLALSLSSL